MERNSEYELLIRLHTPRSRVIKSSARAFIFGGAICLMGELLAQLYRSLGAKDEAYLYVTLSFILIGSLSTSLGFFDRFAVIAGAGALVPVTGFANAVTSSAIDTRCEGYIGGVGTKIFTVAGPVILYSSLAGFLYGLVYFFVDFFT